MFESWPEHPGVRNSRPASKDPSSFMVYTWTPQLGYGSPIFRRAKVCSAYGALGPYKALYSRTWGPNVEL